MTATWHEPSLACDHVPIFRKSAQNCNIGQFASNCLVNQRAAQVIGTASARNLDLVRRLGALAVIDYQAQRFENVVRDVDVVFDTVGGETLTRSWAWPQERSITRKMRAGASETAWRAGSEPLWLR